MGKLTRRKKGGNWHGEWTDLRGERQRKSLRTKDKAVARTRLRSAELGQTDETAAGPAKALAVAIDEMLSLKREQTRLSYQRKALHLLRVLGEDIMLHELSRDQVANYIAQRKRETASSHTIHKELVVLRQALKEAKRRDTYLGPIDIVPSWSAEYQPRDRYLTRTEFNKLIAATRHYYRTWIYLQVFTSANLSEVTKMTWQHVDLEQGVITVPGTKRTSRYRRVPIHPELRAHLESLDRRKGLHGKRGPWTRPNKSLERLCKRAKIPRVSTNDLRRTFGSWLKQAGVDSRAVADMMGHNSSTMVDRVYGRLSPVTYKKAIDQMPGQDDTPATQKSDPPKKGRGNKRKKDGRA